MIYVEIDEITPCLQDTKTGEIVQTEVIEIRRKSFLKKYNKVTGWYVAWDKLLDESRVFALVISGTVDIQGLVAIKETDEMGCVFVPWMVAAPQNNLQISKEKRYSGVGGHLFAIAVDCSIKAGYGGALCGFAANEKLLSHYEQVFNAEHIGILHRFQFIINEEDAVKIKEEYSYEWTEDEL